MKDKIIIHVTPDHPNYKQIGEILKRIYQRMQAAEQLQQASK